MSARGIDRWFPSKNGGMSFKDYCRHTCQHKYNVNVLLNFKEREIMDQYSPLGCFYFPQTEVNDKTRVASCSWNDKVWIPNPKRQRTSTPGGSTQITEKWEFEVSFLSQITILFYILNMRV